MAAEPKKTVGFRLSETTIKELMAIAKHQKVSQADVITVLIHQFYSGAEFDDIDTWFDIVRMS